MVGNDHHRIYINYVLFLR